MEQYAVLMAVYYKEKPEYLRQSIKSMLEQTVPPEEFVLVCDGPLTAELYGIIEDFDARNPGLFQIVQLETNRGLGAALNVGLQHCRQELVARMDSDDLAMPRRMEQLLSELEQHPQVSVIGGQIAEFDADPRQVTGYRIVPCEHSQILSQLKRKSPMNHTSTLLRKSHVLQVGGYREMTGYEDYLLWAKLICAGFQLRNIPQVCCAVRADAGMYARRGGLGYFRNSLTLENYLLQQNLITPWEYGLNVLVRFGGNVLLPSCCRRLAFLLFLRKQTLPVLREESSQNRRIPSASHLRRFPGYRQVKP